MKISNKELRLIKKEMPRVFQILSTDFFELDPILIANGYKKLAFCIWDHWLNENEVHLLTSNNKTELKRRQSNILQLLESLYVEKETFVYKYCNWKNKMVIRKPFSKVKLILNSNIQNLTLNGGGGFKLILPKYKAIVEMDFDWTGSIIFIENEFTTEFFKHFSNSNLYLLEYKE